MLPYILTTSGVLRMEWKAHINGLFTNELHITGQEKVFESENLVTSVLL